MKHFLKISIICILFPAIAYFNLFASTEKMTWRKNKPVDSRFLDEQPVFKGDTLKKYLNHQLQYPELAAKDNVSGIVYLSLVINEDGTVSNTKVLKKLGYGCDQEAMRLVQLTSGKWIAGRVNGQPVKSLYRLPVKFRAQ
jgi:TonB family protein